MRSHVVQRPRPTTPRRMIAAALAAVLGISVAVAVFTAGAPGADAAVRGTVMSRAAAYGRARGYHVGIAVWDTKTGRRYGSGSHAKPFASESVVKAFIATRLIVQGRMHGTTAARAYKMITQSDDGIASAFYGSVGGDSLINWVKRRYHVPDLGSPPRRSGWWGNTHITPDGLVHFYAKVKRDKRVAPWLLHAMHHARTYGSDGTYQFFGLPSATSRAAVKQGWGDDFDDWGASADYNTTGFVNGDRYAVAILARGPVGTYGGAIGAMLTHTARLLLPHGQFPAPAPRITSLSVASGRSAGGQRITVRGSDFTQVTGVSFGHKWAARKVLSPTRLRVVTPAHRAATLNMRVQTTHGWSNPRRYRFVDAPAVTAVTPDSGGTAGMTTVRVSGHNFTSQPAVSVGPHAATSVRLVSATALRAVVPAHAADTLNVRVRSRYGLSPVSSGDRYTYLAPAPTAPTGS